MQDLCYDEREESLDIYKDYSILLCKNYEEMEKLAKGNKEREALVNFLKKLGSDREFMDFIDREEFKEIIAKTELEEAKSKAIEEGHAKGHAEGLKEGHAEGLKEGIQEGSLNAKKNIILKMNSLGFSIDDIANSVELSKKEVLSIINSNEEEGN